LEDSFGTASFQNYLSGETIPATEAFLFNLKDDVGETKNLYASNPEKVAELLAALDKKAKTIGTNVASLPQRLPADDSHIKNYFKRHPEQKRVYEKNTNLGESEFDCSCEYSTSRYSQRIYTKELSKIECKYKLE
jgi:hypothetical protein